LKGGVKHLFVRTKEIKMKWTSIFMCMGVLAIGLLFSVSASVAAVQPDDVRVGTTGVVASQPDSNILLAGRERFDDKKFRDFDRDDFKKFDRGDFEKRKFDKDRFKKFDKDDFEKFDKFD
jgi:hypothetical protein